MRATKFSKPRAASYAAVGLMIAFLVPASASAGHPSTGHDAMTLDIEDYVGTLRIIPNTEDKIETDRGGAVALPHWIKKGR